MLTSTASAVVLTLIAVTLTACVADQAGLGRIGGSPSPRATL
jgi:hypothetical protein